MMAHTSSKKRRRWPWILLALLLFLFVLFAATRYSSHTTYVPFSGRIFRLSQADVTAISIQSGSSGDLVELRPQGAFRPAPNTGALETVSLPPDSLDFNGALALMNGLRYRYWLPDFSGIFGAGRAGWSYRVILDFRDGSSASYVFGDDWIRVRGLTYHSAPGALSGLSRLVDAEATQ